MATNVKYLKENNLYEAHKHFMRLSEAYIPTMFPEDDIEEAGEDQDPNAMGGQDPMGGGAPMGGDPNAMGGGMPQDPNAMGGGPNAMGGQDPMAGGDPNGGMPMGGDPMAQDPNAMGGTDPMADPMGDDMGGEDPLANEDEEDNGDTINIDGLTKAEDKLNVKQNNIGRDISKVDNRISSLIDSISNLLQKVDSNNAEIEALKSEFEKRNPTQTEKLNLRSLDSYPFNVKPTDYWSQKAKEGGYEAYSDNAEPTTQEYTITNDDVDNPAEDIASTFFKINDDDIQTLDKLFKF
jgi:hypothetical protein